ncbi:MAG: cell division protein FtsL [Wenzhouxiangellaceae bacterium]|nr:cell division protein FtsL [Wenzhouxiangellaceae bacterium]
MRTWIVAVALLAAVGASAIALVGLKHESRQLFIRLEEAARQHDGIQVEWSRLQLELALVGETGRIEEQASSTLRMHEPERIGVLVKTDD